MKRAPVLFGGLLLIAFALRFVWPLADPPATLSWSSGVLTDPAAVVFAAREATVTGEWPISRDLLFYPLMNALTWAVFALLGPDRLASQMLAALLGTVAVGGFAAALWRSGGPRAGLTTAAVLGAAFWPAMFARIPLVENLTGALLGIATLLAIRGGRGHEASAFVGAIAALFGKAHAVPFLPALFVFVALRERSLRSLGRPALAVAAIAVLWFVSVFLPHRADITDQIARAGEASLGGNPLLAPLSAIRTSWVFHRMPILSAIGLWFVLQTIFVPTLRRERLAAGSALLPLMFVSFWIYTSMLPYQAPRYYVPAVCALVAGAVALAVERAERKTPPRPKGRGAWAVAFLFPFLVGLGLLEGTVHVATFLDGATRLYLGASGERLAAFTNLLKPFPRNVLLAAVVALAMGFLLRPGRARRRPSRTLRLAAATGVVAIATVQWVHWAATRSESLEEARRSLEAILPENARVFGAFAPALSLGTDRPVVPSFGEESVERWERSGATHLLLESPGGNAFVARLAAEQPGRLVPLREWALRHRHVRTIRLYARTDGAFPATEFEGAAADLMAGRAADTVRRLEAARRDDVPDFHSLEAQARFETGDRAGARACLERALAVRENPSDLFHLGELAQEDGDRELARESFRRALVYNPWDGGVARSLAALESND